MSLTPVPSAQVAACAALAGSEAVDRLKLSLSPRTGCSANPEPAGEAALTQRSLNFPCGGHDWPLLASAEFGSRVLYTMRWKLPEGFARPQRPWPGNDLPVQEVEVMNALDVIAYAAQIDPIQQYGGRIVIIGSSANDIGDVFRTSVGTMPGFLIIANAIRSGVETGPVYASSGYLSGLLVTIVMTMMTFALWLWCRQHPMYGVMLFKYSALVLGTVVWFFAATWVLSSGQTIEFVFPQYLATAYLLFAESWRSVV